MIMTTNTVFEKHTHIKTKVFKFAHRWTIDNFADYNYYYCSYNPSIDFQSPTNSKLTFQLSLNSNVRTDNVDYVTANFKVINCPKNRVNVQLQLSILNGKTKKCNTKEATFEQARQYSWNKYIARDYLLKPENDLVPDNKLTLLCEILYDDDIEEPEIVSGQAQLEKHSQIRIVKDFGDLWKTTDLSDVVFVVGSKQFRAHKAILGTRSSVFSEMFAHKIDDNPIVFSDLEDPDAFEELLRYMYTGKVLSLDQFAIALFPVANKYDLKHLKSICEDSICSNISTGILTEILELANKYDAKKLKVKIVEYIQSYANCIFETKSLKEMLQTQPELFYEIFCDLMENIDSR